MSRRDMMRGALALAAAMALKPSDASATPGYEHLPLDPEDEEYFQKLLTDPAALADFREHPSQENLGRVTRALARTKTTWTETFQRQEGRLHAGARALFNAEGKHVGNGTVVRVPDRRRQGAFRYVLVTASHVARHVPEPRGSVWIRHPGGADISVRELTQEERSQLAGPQGAFPLAMAPERAHEDIGGKVGAVIGLDSDYGRLERKIYPSRVSPCVTRAFLRACGVSDFRMDEALVQTEEIRLIVLPRAENMLVPFGGMAAQGMSGGGLVYMPEGSNSVAFGGIFLGFNYLFVDGASYVMGHIADHFQVRDAIENLFNDPAAQFAAQQASRG